MLRFKIEVYQHGFQVRVMYESDKSYLFEFCKRYTQFDYVWNPKRKQRLLTPTNVYATSSPDRMSFGFLLEDLDEFLIHLKISGISESEYNFAHIPAPEGVDIKFSLPNIVPRENQPSALRFLAESEPIRVLPLPTGQGKTLTTLLHLAEYGKRTVLFMKACHIKTWTDTLVNFTDIDKKDIVVVKGNSALRAIMALGAVGELHAKIIIISASTFSTYLQTFISGSEETGLEFDVAPDKFIETIGAGVAVTDECHELIKGVVRRAIMLNVKKHIYLSATLKPGKVLMDKIYRSVFPIKDRFTDFKNNDHIVVHPVYWHLKKPKDAKYQGSQGYSQLIFEQYILDNKEIKERYLDMIADMVERYYMENTRKPGMRCAIFAARVEMCEAIRDKLKIKLGDSIGISTYNSDTPDDVLDDADNAEIIVTTPGSCGTGKDIPNLAVTIMTIALGAIQLSEQVLGRTRPIKLYPDVDPRFYYFTCRSIDRHLIYDRSHQEEFKDKTKEIVPINLPAYV